MGKMSGKPHGGECLTPALLTSISSHMTVDSTQRCSVTKSFQDGGNIVKTARANDVDDTLIA